MTRSKIKGPHIDSTILKYTKSYKVTNTYSRRSIIHPGLIDAKIGIHNGKSFKVIRIKEQMVGHKIGEFAPTRMLYLFKRKKQISKKIKKKN